MVNGGSWLIARSARPVGLRGWRNRIVSSRTMPSAFKQIPVERLASFFVHLQTRCGGGPSGIPKCQKMNALLSSGPTHPYYFEDVYLARYLGYGG
ncbi:MAG: circularly permuted type 2 ATP-grasp protein [Planctomycetaceae bacterium]